MTCVQLAQYVSVETVNVLLNAALQFNLEHLVERCEAFILRSLSLASLMLSILLLPPPSLPPEDLSRLLALAPTDNASGCKDKILSSHHYYHKSSQTH